jgi:hypothetical protein
MGTPLLPVRQAGTSSPTSLTAHQFHTFAAIPPELESYANLPNSNTRRADHLAAGLVLIGIRLAIHAFEH